MDTNATGGGNGKWNIPAKEDSPGGLQRVGLGSGRGSAPGLLGMSEGGPDGTQGRIVSQVLVP